MPQLMEVLEYFDNTGDTMIKRLPEEGECEIKWGAQLTVRESQNAIFFRDGQTVAIFEPGRYILKTMNIPVLTKFVTWWGYGPDSPFRAEVYFVNNKLFTNLKWGTREPIIYRDPELQMIRLRAFGIFSIQICDPTTFLNTIVGTQGVYRDSDLKDYLKNIIAARLVDLLGEDLNSIFDLPGHYNELADKLKVNLTAEFKTFGIKLVDFLINAITPPPEVQKIIDDRSGMAAIGDLNKYMQFKAATSLEKAASNEGSGAASGMGAGIGMGAGVGMGMMIPGMLQGSFQQQNQQGAVVANNIEKDPFNEIKRLKELLDLGAITQEEFDLKKKTWLNKI